MIIGLIGRKGSGKGAVAKILGNEPGTVVYRMSDVLRNIADILGIDQTRSNLIELSEVLRKSFGENIIATAMVKKIKEDASDLIVIDGIRRQADLDGFHELDMTLVNVTAPLDIRFERVRSRGDNDRDEMTRKDFERLESAPTELSIGEIERQAAITIENTGTLDELMEKIRAVLK